MQKTLKKMTKTMANGYPSESAKRELSNEYHLDRVWMVFEKSLRPSALDKRRLSIGRGKRECQIQWDNIESHLNPIMMVFVE